MINYFRRSPLVKTLLDAGVVTREQVAKARKYMKMNPDLFLGDALVVTGALDKEKLDALLEASSCKKSAGPILMKYAAKRQEQKIHAACDEFTALFSGVSK